MGKDALCYVNVSTFERVR